MMAEIRKMVQMCVGPIKRAPLPVQMGSVHKLSLKDCTRPGVQKVTEGGKGEHTGEG